MILTYGKVHVINQKNVSCEEFAFWQSNYKFSKLERVGDPIKITM